MLPRKTSKHFMKKLFFAILLVLMIVKYPLVSLAQSSGKVLLFWSSECQYCLQVENKISELGLDEKVDIEHVEVHESNANLDRFRE